MSRFLGYEVTACGKVFSITHNWRGYGSRELTQNQDKYGYMQVRLTANGRRKRYRVHRLVAGMYLPPKPPWADQIRHLDGDKTNNVFTNLRWGNAKENAMDRKRHGRTSCGESHSIALRNSCQAERIREYFRRKKELKNAQAQSNAGTVAHRRHRD